MKRTLLLSTVIGLLLACAKPVTSSVGVAGTYLAAQPPDNSWIVWADNTLRKIAPLPGQAAGYCGYARLIQRADNTLLCVYEASGQVALVRSADGGNTWSGRVVVAASEPGVSMAVPEIVELADRSLLVAYNPRPGRNAMGKRFGIRTVKSDDGGATWTDNRLVYEAGTRFDDGCWEPAALQLPSGEVQLYFSDEGVYTNSNEQNISLMRSTDGGLTWTAKPEVVSFRAGKRDGMPVPIVLNGTDIAFSMEDNDQTTFKPYIIRNRIADNWQSGPVGGDSPNRSYALSQPLSESVYAGAPYLRQLKSGITILGVQSTESRSSNQLAVSRLVVYLGDREARNFKHPSEPFRILPTHSGLWNSLSVLRGDTVVALTSTKSYGGANAEVWMIKGHMVPNRGTPLKP
ncbi:sialidase family protein [Fibrella arboris]|uniref:sialidase family protein n=1 Tax=Fibrella arboris TaxID=3242486 RepID=UPI003521BD78